MAATRGLEQRPGSHASRLQLSHLSVGCGGVCGISAIQFGNGNAKQPLVRIKPAKQFPSIKTAPSCRQCTVHPDTPFIPRKLTNEACYFTRELVLGSQRKAFGQLLADFIEHCWMGVAKKIDPERPSNVHILVAINVQDSTPLGLRQANLVTCLLPWEFKTSRIAVVTPILPVVLYSRFRFWGPLNVLLQRLPVTVSCSRGFMGMRCVDRTQMNGGEIEGQHRPDTKVRSELHMGAGETGSILQAVFRQPREKRSEEERLLHLGLSVICQQCKVAEH